MEPLAAPIHIPIVPSPCLNRSVTVTYFIVIALMLIGLPWKPLSFILIAGVVASLIGQYRARRAIEARIEAVLWRSDGQWMMHTTTGDNLGAELRGGVFVSRWAISFVLKPQRQARVRIVLTQDNTDRDTYRRLCVRFRWPLGG